MRASNPFNTYMQKGYTGHEHLDELGLIHMNGRVYDMRLRRFLSADPLIQAPLDTQSYNRYSYVKNNPLKYTDPSGFSWLSKALKKVGRFIKNNWRTIVAVAISVVAPYAGFSLMGSALSGFAAGMVASGGDLRAGIVGALTASAFYGIGRIQGVGNAAFGTGGHVAKVVLHGSVGGLSSVAQGGKFGHQRPLARV